jgi:hypothetical protein
LKKNLYMSTKTISVEQIASPILLSSSDLASLRLLATSNSESKGSVHNVNSNRLLKNKSYSFLMSKHLIKRPDPGSNSTDSMLSSQNGHYYSSIGHNTSVIIPRRNFIKTRSSLGRILIIYLF